MKIAVLGGRFDPPHIGHLLIAQQVLEKRPEIDELWFLPANKHQWKPTVANANDRLAMVQMMQNARMIVSNMELVRPGISYSIDTIREIKQTQNAEVFWIVGSDILPEFHRWGKADQLTKEATFLVFPRDPYDLPKKLPQGFELISGTDLATTNLSSTIIRERIKKQLPITHLVLPEVEAYIKTHNLYI